MKSKVLITGGAGFIGNAIINRIHEDYNVVVLDNFSPQIHGDNYEESFLYLGIKDKCEIINGDVCNPLDMARALQGAEYVIHLAAETGTGQSMYELNKYTNVNILGTSNLLESILKNKMNVKKIILSSSRSVYGEGMYKCETHGIVVPNSRVVEDMVKKDFEPKCPICGKNVELTSTTADCEIKPISMYAYTKMAQEKMLELMCPSMGIDYTIFRYQNVFGPGQSLNNPYTGILSIFSKRLLNNQDINIFEDGLESRDFVHVKDIAAFTVNALENPKTNSKYLNVGSGESTSVMKVAETLKNMYGSSSNISVSGDFRIGDIRHNKADMEDTIACCGFKPHYTFEMGMKEFSDWVIAEDAKKKIGIDDAFEKSLAELAATGMILKGK
ncbi:MAG: NAD-dependent epimerase/dehydratase family protein [Clostridiaceae bacterium]